jgi:hypothetical protein
VSNEFVNSVLTLALRTAIGGIFDALALKYRDKSIKNKIATNESLLFFIRAFVAFPARQAPFFIRG